MEKTLAFEITPLLKEKVKEELIATHSEDAHQAIMNVAYDLYKKHLAEMNKKLEIQGQYPKRWLYSDLCEYTKENLGSLAEFAVLIGKYNQQVENGGHYQYWDNGYGSSTNDIYRDLYLHMDLLDYFKAFKDEISFMYKDEELSEINKTVNEVMTIMQELPETIYWTTKIEYTGFDCNGEPSPYDPEEDSNELSEDSRRRLEYLDNSYYKINSKLMDILNLYFYNYLNQE